jgi:hypothetical protein
MVANMFNSIVAAFKSVYSLSNLKSLFKEDKPMSRADELIQLVNRVAFTDKNGANLKDYTTYDQFVEVAGHQKFEVVTEIKLNGPADLSEVAAALQSITTPIPTRSTPKGPMLYSGKGLYTDDHTETKSSEPGEFLDLEADMQMRSEHEATRKLYADGQEYTLHSDNGLYLKHMEVNDPNSIETTYDRVLDEWLSNPSAVGLKVTVTKDKLVATLEYKS